MKLSTAILSAVCAQEFPLTDVEKSIGGGPHGGGKFGDLILQPWQVQHFTDLGYDVSKLKIDETASYLAPRELRASATKWTETDDDGFFVVPYAFQDNVPAEQWQSIHDELADLTLSLGCVKFVYDPTATYYNGIHVVGDLLDPHGCSTYFGQCTDCIDPTESPPVTNVPSGWQVMRLSSQCQLFGGVHHLFLHAIGMHHEVDRPDFLDHFEEYESLYNSDVVNEIPENDWINTGHPLEPSSVLMYQDFKLLNGKEYIPHYRLTSTDAEQAYAFYCTNKQDTHPMEPRTSCLEPDVVDVVRPVFEHRICDGHIDCLHGEDEDGRLGDCGPPVQTDLGCCAAIFIYYEQWSVHCISTGELYNGKDVYACPSVHPYMKELKWEPDRGWVLCASDQWGGCFNHWAWTGPDPDNTCFGDNGELDPNYVLVPSSPYFTSPLSFACQLNRGVHWNVPTEPPTEPPTTPAPVCDVSSIPESLAPSDGNFKWLCTKLTNGKRKCKVKCENKKKNVGYTVACVNKNNSNNWRVLGGSAPSCATTAKCSDDSIPTWLWPAGAHSWTCKRNRVGNNCKVKCDNGDDAGMYGVRCKNKRNTWAAMKGTEVPSC